MDATRRQVVANIREQVAAQRFNEPVEPGDARLDGAQIRALLRREIAMRERLPYKVKNMVARVLAKYGTVDFTRGMTIEGIEKMADIHGGAIITNNHFAPFDSSIIRMLNRRVRSKKMFTVSKDINFAATGLFGFILRYTDLIPVSQDTGYMLETFEPMLREVLESGHLVLIYPEQEMWWNYRKPRPLKRGSYLYAAKMKVPVIPCFTEMREREETAGDGSRKLRFILHVLDPIYPDPALSDKENSIRMMENDYSQKVTAYERVYGKKLDYTFSAWDIAGISESDL